MADSGNKRTIAAGAVLTLGSVLLLFLTRTAEQYDDSLNYAVSIKTGIDLFHPHHLLFNPMVRGIYLLWAAVGGRITAVDAAQVHNILWAAVAVAAVFLWIRRCLDSVRAGWLAGLGLLVSLGFWEYATQAQIYIPALAVLACAVLVVQRASTHGWTRRRWFLLGFLYVLAMLYHQTNILFIIPLAAFIIVRFGRAEGRRLAAFFVTTGTAMAAIYIGIFWAFVEGEKSIRGFLRFLLHYHFHPDPLWGTLRNVGPEGISYLLFSQLRDFIPVVDPYQKIAVAAFGFLLLGLAAWNLAALFRREAANKPWRAMILVWLVVHFLFFLWWSPREKNMFIISLLPLAGLAALAIGDLRAAGRPTRTRTTVWTVAGAVLLLAVAAGNWTAFIRPHHLSLGPAYEEARSVARCASPEDFVLATFNVRENLRYYFGRTRILQAEIIPLSICQDLSLPAEYGILAETPFALPFRLLLPQTKISMISGYDHPSGWKRYLGLLFGVRENPGGGAVACRAFASLSGSPGYIRIDTNSVALDGWPDFLARLDALGAAAFGAQPRSFQQWVEKTGVLIKNR
jgi:hypothetical protein